MKTLVQLNATANWGSTGKIAEGIGRQAMTRGWKSYIAYGRMMNPSASQLIRVGTYAGNVMHYIRDRVLDGEGLGSRRSTQKLIARLREIDPEVVHLHNIHDHWLNYPLLFDYLASSSAKVVWTFHDCWAFTGHCYHFEHIGCDRWSKEGCHDCPQKGAIDRSGRNFEIKRQMVDRLGRRLTIVPTSDWINNKSRKSVIFKSSIHSVIKNGIDLSVFKRSASKSKLVLGVSNVWPDYKGLQDFVALRQILPSDYRILLIGLTDKQIAALPEGIEGRTRTQSVEELVGYYSSALAFVNPTHCDTFPTVNLEALACGTPVVTYRTGGSPEAVDQNTGIVVEQNDIKGLCDAIISIGSSPGSYTPGQCRARAEKHFDRDKQFGLYIDLYESLFEK